MKQNRPAGYAFLLEKNKLDAIPNWHSSWVGQTGKRSEIIQDGLVETTYPLSYWPGECDGNHLEFALKYDGINLATLALLFEVIDASSLSEWIASKPTGKYARKIWFLYEYLTGRKLPLQDLTQGNYIDLLENKLYYTSKRAQPLFFSKTEGNEFTFESIASRGNASGNIYEAVQRQRINNNLAGSPEFCPIVRRTEKLTEMERIDIAQRCREIVTAYPPELLKRALSYLYGKETRASFEIEHIRPDSSRSDKFITLLTTAEHRDFCEKALLIEIQNSIVDPRFCDTDYRQNQNYVGQTVTTWQEKIHYISPKPEDLTGLMEGLVSTHQKLKRQPGIPAVIHAAIIAYGFVFLHPFEDGNGRIHRFLIHNILAQRGLVPEGLMFPVSAAMLNNKILYDRSLEAFSIPLLKLIDYELNDSGEITVSGQTGIWYRYIDMTAQVEALYEFVIKTIDEELKNELDILVGYDRTKKALQEIVDMPDRQIDLFIRLCLQNSGHLSATKRESHFGMLTDEEIERMEAAVRTNYAS
ncbi:MAG: Fic family protein [Chlorobiaceae bacterium]|nr:Fic family protein [Chlorobiaceae bacterium]